jgi:hypothetical protein
MAQYAPCRHGVAPGFLGATFDVPGRDRVRHHAALPGAA